MKLKIYPILLRYQSREILVAWYSDQDDFLLTTEADSIVAFQDLSDFRSRCCDRFDPDEEAPARYDFDRLQEQVSDGLSGGVDAVEILNTWNLFDDLSRSCRRTFAGNLDRFDDLYDRIFYANNLPSITPIDSQFDPIWTPEKSALCEVLQNGLDLLGGLTFEERIEGFALRSLVYRVGSFTISELT